MAQTLGPRERAYRQLSELLHRGVFPAGSRLPGERSLATRLDVSRATLRLALLRLASEGALAPSAQRGWFVPQILVGEPPSVLQSFTEMAESRGLRATAEVLSLAQRACTLTESESLRIAPAAAVVELRRLRGMDGVPVTIETAIIPVTIGGWLLSSDLTDRSLYALLAERGILPHRSAYTVQAMTADEEQAGLLRLAAGAAVLIASDVTYLADRTPVLMTHNCYRGDAYRFEADLFRPA